ncbi:hypothetical protein SRHO_G00243830 [Serrasalmus rhombeus]
MWRGRMSHGTNHFALTVGLMCGTDPMKPWSPFANKALVVVPYRCGPRQSCMPSCAERTTRASTMIGASAPRAKNYKRPECECWNGPVSLHSSQSDHKRLRTVSVQAAGKEQFRAVTSVRKQLRRKD